MEHESVSKKNQEEISHLAIDIGGTLIKMIYFSNNSNSADDEGPLSVEAKKEMQNGNMNLHVLPGHLCFQKFETKKINDCIEFLSSKKLQNCVKCCSKSCDHGKTIVKATGGGAFKFANLFREKLGITLDKADEMDCLVAGSNLLLKVDQSEVFTYSEGRKEYLHIDQNDLYPHLLVNIGSGVSMLKVDGDGKFQRISGTSVGGGTFLGLGKLLTNCKSFDELLELSHQGNNGAIDMLVGDIFGGIDYSKLGLTSSNIASSFGKAISDVRELEDYKPGDIACSLLRMISNNLGQLAYLNALRFGLKRIFFAGFFIRGHEYTMDTISVAVNFWSKGEAKAMFLRHEGFLGALGAFMSCKRDPLDDLLAHDLPDGSRSTKNGIRNCNVAENGSTERRVQLST